MGNYNIVSPGAMVAGQPEDISPILANFQAIAAILNGGLDNSNVNAAAAIAASKLAGYPATAIKALLGDGTWGFAGPGSPVTALPGAPGEAQPILFMDNIITPTYIWLLQWSGNVGKWVCIGGSPVNVEINTAETVASASAYIDLTTPGPSFTIPKTGTYDITFGADLSGSGGAGTAARVAVKLGAAATSDNDSAGAIIGVPFAYAGGTIRRTLTVGDVVKMQYKQTGSATAQNRRLSIRPFTVN